MSKQTALVKADLAASGVLNQLFTFKSNAEANVTGTLTAAIINAIVFELVGKTVDMICVE